MNRPLTLPATVEYMLICTTCKKGWQSAIPAGVCACGQPAQLRGRYVTAPLLGSRREG